MTALPGNLPEHDVLLTNPPYSGDHVERLARFAVANGKPFLLLLPDHFAGRSTYRRALGGVAPLLLVPKLRYHYWTPPGLRQDSEGEGERSGHRNLQLGQRNSPYCSIWHAATAPLLSSGEVRAVLALSGAKEAGSAEGMGGVQGSHIQGSCLRAFDRREDIGKWGTAYRDSCVATQNGEAAGAASALDDADPVSTVPYVLWKRGGRAVVAAMSSSPI